MPIVFSDNFVLQQPDLRFPVTEDHPVIGWHNIVTPTNVAATFQDTNYPASNLANPATHLEWRGTEDGVQYITVTTNYVDEIDYVAVARHNLGSDQLAVAVGYFDSASPPVWHELVAERLLADDAPALFRFTPQSLARVSLRINVLSDLIPARIAVLYVGKLLTLERKIYAGHVPLPHGRKNEAMAGMSETGNFLGRNILGSWRESAIPLSLISPDFYREFMDAFIDDAKTKPFFFAWRPSSYPDEVGYAWLMEDPAPVPTPPTNKLSFELKVRGVV